MFLRPGRFSGGHQVLNGPMIVAAGRCGLPELETLARPEWAMAFVNAESDQLVCARGRPLVDDEAIAKRPHQG